MSSLQELFPNEYDPMQPGVIMKKKKQRKPKKPEQDDSYLYIGVGICIVILILSAQRKGPYTGRFIIYYIYIYINMNLSNSINIKPILSFKNGEFTVRFVGVKPITCEKCELLMNHMCTTIAKDFPVTRNINGLFERSILNEADKIYLSITNGYVHRADLRKALIFKSISKVYENRNLQITEMNY